MTLGLLSLTLGSTARPPRRGSPAAPDEGVPHVDQLRTPGTDRSARARRRRGLRDAVRPGGRRPRRRRRRARHAPSRLPARRRRPDAARQRPSAAARLGAAGARRTTSTVLRDAVPAALPGRGRRPGARRRDRHRLHRLHDGADHGRRHAALRAAGVRRPSRTPTSSSGSTTPLSRRPTGSTSWPASASEPWLPRYGGLISSEWEFAKGLQLLEEDPERLRRDGALGRGRRLDRLAAHRHLRPQRLHRRVQGHPPGRRLPVDGVPAPSSTRLRAASSRTSSTTRSGSSATAPAALSAQAADVDRAARGDRGGGRQRRRARHRRRPRRPSSPARWSRSWAPRPATS